MCKAFVCFLLSVNSEKNGETEFETGEGDKLACHSISSGGDLEV